MQYAIINTPRVSGLGLAWAITISRSTMKKYEKTEGTIMWMGNPPFTANVVSIGRKKAKTISAWNPNRKTSI
jgi:hypothetical protein